MAEFELVPETEVSDNGQKSTDLPKTAIRRSVEDVPESTSQTSFAFTLPIFNFINNVPEWGPNIWARDRALRDFWPTEPYLSSAVYSTTARNAGFEFKLEGPPRLVKTVKRVIFDQAEQGKGWLTFVERFCIDLYTQDNGVFVEIIRSRKSPNAPVIGINHLDSNRCRRTGIPVTPVVYTDRKGVEHELKWYEVVAITEFSSPIEDALGLQLCAVSRVLLAAQIIKDISTYNYEKVSGRFAKAIHVLSGVSTSAIEDAITTAQEQADNRGLINYLQPFILGSIDPSSQVSHVQVDLASLPDAFDLNTFMQWYVAAIALTFGTDYQEFAPLPGGNLGTAQQSEILHRKTRGKGPALFMAIMTELMNNYILPEKVTFSYEEQDVEAEQVKARISSVRADIRSKMIKSGEISPQTARKMAVESGDLSEELAVEEDRLEEERKLEAERIQSENPSINNADFDTPRGDNFNPEIDVTQETGQQ
jgi:hypothetical protein